MSGYSIALPNPRVASFAVPLFWLRRAWRSNRPLTIVGAAMRVTLLATIVGLVVDPRVIAGAPAWLKPAKFAISIAIYTFTLAWFLSFVQGRRRLVAVVAWGTAVALPIEEAVILLQVARGTTSHFNVATPFDAAVWRSMAVAIAVVWGLGLLTAVLLLRQRLADPSLAWALRLGVLVALVGMAVAFPIANTTLAQEAVAVATGAMPIAGAHAVDVEDGGPGLPIVGWSTEGGDLRAPHFFRLHALQVLPFVAWLLARFAPAWLGARGRTMLAGVAGVAYLGLVLLLSWQALRGQSIVAPDAATLATFVALLVVAGLAAGAIVRRARRTSRAAICLVAFALLAMVAGTTADAQDGTPPAGTPVGGLPPGVQADLLAVDVTAAVPAVPAAPALIELIKFTVEPGSIVNLPENSPSTALVYVETGTLTAVVESPVTVSRTVVGGTREDIAAGVAFTADQGDFFIAPANVAVEARNDRREPPVLLMAVIEPAPSMPPAGTPVP